MPRIDLTLLKPNTAARALRFDCDVVTMGRSSECQIPLDDRYLSRKHAEITAERDAWVLRDNGSTNGTYLNGKRVTAPVTLKPGDRVQLGSAEVVFGETGADGMSATSLFAGPSVTDRGVLPPTDFVLDEREIPESSARSQVVSRLALELISDRPMGELFEFIIENVVRTMNPSRAALALLDEDGSVEIVASRQTDGTAPEELRISRTMVGEVARNRKVVAYTDFPGEHGGSDSIVAQCIYSALCVPLIAADSVLGVLYLDHRSAKRQITREDAELATQIARVAAVKLESTRLREAAVEKGRLEETIQLARAIQMRMLPSVTPELSASGRLSLAAEIHPAKEVGGDFYDFHLTGDDRLYFCIGDVSGKGIPAALTMAVTRALFRSMILAGLQPGAMMTAINRQLCDEMPSTMFVTAFCAVLDLGTHTMHHATAGHLPPLIVTRDGEVRPLQSAPGLVLGHIPDIDYVEETVRLETGDAICLYTDGISEAENAAEEMFSIDRLRDVLAKNAREDVDTIVRNTLAAVSEFAGQAPQSDDLAMVLIRSNAAAQ